MRDYAGQGYHFVQIASIGSLTVKGVLRKAWLHPSRAVLSESKLRIPEKKIDFEDPDCIFIHHDTTNDGPKAKGSIIYDLEQTLAPGRLQARRSADSA
jgi:hypothetical protein